MKSLLILLLGFGAYAQASVLMNCHAKATSNDKMVFEISSIIYDIRVAEQSSTINTLIGKKSKKVVLQLISEDLFTDKFSIKIYAEITTRKGTKVIENWTMQNLLLSNNVGSYELHKNFDDYKMDLVCTRP